MSQDDGAEPPFSRIPFEIRYMIFEAVLQHDDRNGFVINLSDHIKRYKRETDLSPAGDKSISLSGLSGQLLRVSKLWNIECSPILYRNKNFRIKGEEVPDLLDRTTGSHSAQYINSLSIGPGEFGHSEAMGIFPALLQRFSSLKRFDFCPTVSPETTGGCQALTFHWKCTAQIPCRQHIMQTKGYVLQFAAGVITSHRNLRVLVGSRKAILPVYSLIEDDPPAYAQVAFDRYSNWDTITRENLTDIREKIAKTEDGWTEDRAEFSSRQAF